MAERLDDRRVRLLPVPATGSAIHYDDAVKGFAARVTAAGARAFILRYRAGGRQRLYTIGSFPDWGTAAARREAKELKRRIDLGEDPMGERQAERAQPTVAEVIDRFVADYLPKKRPMTARDDTSLLAILRQALGSRRLADLGAGDIDRLHRKLSAQAPYRANRLAAVTSVLMNFAIRHGWRTDNPVRGLERNHEDRRERFLSGAEIAALLAALQAHADVDSADAIRLLLLTGARRGEVLAASWEQFDLAAGVWTKPSAHTKQKKTHRVPLSAAAVQLLTAMRQRRPGATGAVGYVFPGAATGRHLVELKRGWETARRRASVLLWASQPETPAGQLVVRLRGDTPGAALPSLAACQAAARAAGLALPAGLTDVRLHDLRHAYASILVSSGLSLPIIGQLLGHTQVSTTARYAHLFDDPLRAATERVGAFLVRASDAAPLAAALSAPTAPEPANRPRRRGARQADLL